MDRHAGYITITTCHRHLPHGLVGRRVHMDNTLCHAGYTARLDHRTHSQCCAVMLEIVAGDHVHEKGHLLGDHSRRSVNHRRS